MTSGVDAVTLSDVSITYEGRSRSAPTRLSAAFSAGATVLVLGPSGCGKSSLILTVNGLLPQIIPADLSGEVHLFGEPAQAHTVAEWATRVAMVFQDPDAQVVTATVFDEVCFALENLRLPVAEILERAADALREVGLWDRRAESPDVLSLGGKQRLAIACALAMRTEILVLDEPTANLDPGGAARVQRVIRTIAQDPDRTLILVEHNLDGIIESVTDLIVLDATGHPAFRGAPREVMRAHGEALLDLGVWLPTAALVAVKLRSAGIELDEFPLTIDELRSQLDGRGTETWAAMPPAGSPPAHPVAQDLVIEVSDLTVRKRKRVLLDSVSLGVRRGEFTAIVGENGAGKSTLMRALGGLERAPRGSIRVAGNDVTRTAPHELTTLIGFVFQNPEHQFVTDTVFDELALGLRQRSAPEPEVIRSVTRMLERFGLEHFADQHPFLLSGGQKRRLSVGTAMITQPEVLLLDEPTFGQDRATANAMIEMLQDLGATGTTVVIVTHDLQLVAERCDRVIAMQAGRIVGDLAPSQLRDPDATRSAGLMPLPLSGLAPYTGTLHDFRGELAGA